MFGGCLESPQWLNLAFAPKFWEVVETYKSSFCLKMNAAWAVWSIIGGGGTQTLLAAKKIFELYALSCSADTKTFECP